MTEAEQKKAAKAFAEYWKDHGDEKRKIKVKLREGAR